LYKNLIVLKILLNIANYQRGTVSISLLAALRAMGKLQMMGHQTSG